MANSYNTDQISITSASTDINVFTATASTTLIKSVRVVHASGTSSATLSIVKSGTSTRSDMNTVALSQNVLTDLINDVLPLESGDVLKVRTSHQPSQVFVSYVENTTSVSGQSIDVLTDVDITTTAPTNGQALLWNSLAGEFQPGDAGGSTATLDDIGNVDTTGKSPNDVLLWNGSNWVDSNRLTELYTQFRSGTNTNIYADGSTTTEGKVELSATGADLKVNITGIEVTETSPGDIEFVVATDATGSTAFTALHIDGSTTANEANILIKQGAQLKFDDGTYTQFLRPSSGITGNTAVVLPDTSGQLAITTELYTDTDADARIAAASVTDLTDVTSAGSGAIITSAERTTLNSALQSVVDDTTPQLGGDLDVQARKITTSTTNGNIELDPAGTGLVQVNGASQAGAIKLMCEAGTHGVTISSPPHSSAATYELTLPDSAGSANQVLKTDGSGNLSWTNQSTGGGSLTAYEEDSLVTSANITINSSVSTASSKIVDIMGDALADTSNANTKKMLGFHTGSGVCVLQGMVDAGNSITGASAGSPLWLGASGSFSASAPTTTNYYSRIVGYYIGTLQGGEVMCYFNPSIDWIQID